MNKKISRWKSISFKFSLIVVLAGLFVIGSVLALAANRHRYNTEIYHDRKVERQESFKIISTLESQPMKGVAIENTYWDEMVEFVQQPNPQFEAEVFSAQLDSYNASNIWVYNPEFELISSVSKGPPNEVRDGLGLSPQQITALFDKSFLAHFYKSTPSGLLEVYGATIHNSDDSAHASQPKGYFFIARQLNQAYIQRLEKETGDEVAIVKPAASVLNDKPDAQSGRITFTLPLRDIDGTPVSYLAVNYDSAAIASLFRSLDHSIKILIVGVIILAIAVYCIVNKIIIRPLNTIYASLLSDNTKSLSELSDKDTEFGRIANLIERSQRQKHEIIETAKQMEQAQASLQARTKEVETINSLMVDRELRMVELKQQIIELKSQLDKAK